MAFLYYKSLLLLIFFTTIVTGEKTLNVNKENIHEFQDNTEAIIEEYDIIIFEKDIESIAFSDTITIKSNINMTYDAVPKKQLKIECPKSDYRMFNITNGAVVELTGFKISNCYLLTSEIFFIKNNSHLNLINMDISSIQIEDSDLIVIEDSSLYFQYLNFNDNIINEYDNHGLFSKNSSLNINNSKFKGNQATYHESDILYFRDYSVVTFENTQFEDNYVDDSNGVLLAYDSNMTMNNLIVSGNICEDCRSGFIFFLYCHMNISNSIFEDNIANNNNGGSLYVYRSVLNVDNSMFYDNIANDWGGAIYANESEVVLTDITLENSYKLKILIGNVATFGGAIYTIRGSLNISNVLIISNNAYEEGGGIYFWETLFEIDGTTFKNNVALNNGGAIYISHYEYGIIKNSNFIKNQADNGGCVFIYKKEIEFENCKFIRNEGNLGVGFYIRKKGSLMINNSKMKNNKGINGTCFYVEEASNVYGQNNIFKKNVAESGSLVYIPDNDNIIIFNNSKYIKNKETVNDGLVYEVDEGINDINLNVGG